MISKTDEQTHFSHDLLTVMSKQDGRRFVYRLLEQAGIYHSSFHTNALTMAHAEGRRQLGLWLLNEIMYSCYPEYQLMMKEAIDERRIDDRQRKHTDS